MKPKLHSRPELRETNTQGRLPMKVCSAAAYHPAVGVHDLLVKAQQLAEALERAQWLAAALEGAQQPLAALEGAQ